MRIFGFASGGFDGDLVTVEVDIRRGLPGTEIVGLAGGAVREARERVRIAIRNSGFTYPPDRILVNLAPAGIRKSGAAFDLPIAAGILCATGQAADCVGDGVMLLGELQLDGTVRPVAGVLAAVASGLTRGVNRFVVPSTNVTEAESVSGAEVIGIDHLRSLACCGSMFAAVKMVPADSVDGDDPREPEGTDTSNADFSDLRGQPLVKRCLEIAAAGAHHLLLFGPPGSGKTMAIRRLPGILPPLSREEALEVTRIHSIAGVLADGGGLLRKRPFRMPHHSASLEGIIGGGRSVRPGEISLAHRGVLFLDEAGEFRANVLQSLREPLEDAIVTIVRAERAFWFPASFQLVLAANPCPCGNLGRENAVCLCAPQDLQRYWKRIGGPLLDRVDMRLPVSPVSPQSLLGERRDSSSEMRARVLASYRAQTARYRGESFDRNGRLPSGSLDRFCPLSGAAKSAFERVAARMSLSTRAMVSILRVARTIADLDGVSTIGSDEILEACQYRRYGDGDYFWAGASSLRGKLGPVPSSSLS